MNLLHRHVAPAALVIAIAVAAGGAVAYWVAPGFGTGVATSPAPLPITLSPGTPASTLIPGRQADVVLSVSNPNTHPLHINSFVLDTGQGTGGFAVDGAHSSCFPPPPLTFVTDTHGGAGWAVPPKVGLVNGKLAVVLTNSLSMNLNAASACQGATTTVFLKAGP